MLRIWKCIGVGIDRGGSSRFMMLLLLADFVVFENQSLAPLDLMAFFFGDQASLWRQVPRLLLHTRINIYFAVSLYRFILLFFNWLAFVFTGNDARARGQCLILDRDKLPGTHGKLILAFRSIHQGRCHFENRAIVLFLTLYTSICWNMVG